MKEDTSQSERGRINLLPSIPKGEIVGNIAIDDKGALKECKEQQGASRSSKARNNNKHQGKE